MFKKQNHMSLTLFYNITYPKKIDCWFTQIAWVTPKFPLLISLFIRFRYLSSFCSKIDCGDDAYYEAYRHSFHVTLSFLQYNKTLTKP